MTAVANLLSDLDDSPLGDTDAFTKQLIENPHVTNLSFGHTGDSNLHIVIDDYKADDFKALKDLVHIPTGKFSGSVSAEHGIGKLKAGNLALSRT